MPKTSIIKPAVIYSLTAIVIVFLILVVRDDYFGLRSKVQKIFPFSKIVDQRIKVANSTAELHLRMFTPSFDGLAQYIETGQELGLGPTRKYLAYYTFITERFPDADEAYSILGLLQFSRGQFQQAEQYYKKAAKLAPEMFWHHYNLGIVYLEQENYKEAKKTFLLARQLDRKATLRRALQSGVYRQIASAFVDKGYDLNVSINAAYNDAELILQKLESGRAPYEFDARLLMPKVF